MHDPNTYIDNVLSSSSQYVVTTSVVVHAAFKLAFAFVIYFSNFKHITQNYYNQIHIANIFTV